MTAAEFIHSCERHWGKAYNEEQRGWLLRDCQLYGEHLEEVFDWLRRNSRYQPRSYDLDNAAQELGILSDKAPDKVESWSDFNISSCKACRGCGVLTVWHEMEGFRPGRVAAVFPYLGESMRQDYEPEPNEREYIYRCFCGASKRIGAKYPIYQGELPQISVQPRKIPPEYEEFLLRLLAREIECEIPF